MVFENIGLDSNKVPSPLYLSEGTQLGCDPTLNEWLPELHIDTAIARVARRLPAGRADDFGPHICILRPACAFDPFDLSQAHVDHRTPHGAGRLEVLSELAAIPGAIPGAGGDVTLPIHYRLHLTTDNRH